MFATRGTFIRSYPATSGSVGQARHDLTEFATAQGMEGEALDRVRISVTEAMANVVVHAYTDDRGEAHVTAARTGLDLWILVADDGCGFQAAPPSPGLGWGLALIANATDEFIIAERAERGTEVRMRFFIES